MLLDALAEPFDPVTEPAARAALTGLWGIEAAALERLDTERDDTFRAGEVLLKVAHPKDDPAVVEMQSAAMRHVALADPGIPIQRIVPTLTGEVWAEVDGRIARVITWFDGQLVDDSPQSRALFEDAGRMLGRLNRALSGFDHPGAHRALAWDLPRLPELRADATGPLHLEVIDRFAQDVAPALERLPHQVIHNDAHPGNLLVVPDAPDRLAGILDWGDSVYSARICDLAVALAYLVPDAPRPWADVEAFTAGFESVVPLLDEERVLLPMLVAARTIMRSVINQALQRDQHTDPHGFYARNDRKLAMILEA